MFWIYNNTLEQDIDEQEIKWKEADIAIPEKLFQQIFVDLQDQIKMRWVLPEESKNIATLIKEISTKILIKIPGHTRWFQIPIRDFSRKWDIISVIFEPIPGGWWFKFVYQVSPDGESVTFLKQEETILWMS
jgi:hypothetical protein